MRREGDGVDREPPTARPADRPAEGVTPQDRPATERELGREDREHLRALQRARQARLVKVLVAAAIILILIVFVIANSEPVPVDFVFMTRHPRLIWVMIGCAVLGGVAGYLIGRPGRQVRLHRRVGDEDRRRPPR